VPHRRRRVRRGSARFAGAVALVIAAGLGGGASRPSGAAPSSRPERSQAPVPRVESLEDTTGDYRISVRRDAPDSISSYLLSIAESTYPSRAMLVRLAEDNGYDMGSDASQGPLWWCDGTGVARVPYAVTAAAVRYYIAQTRQLREIATRIPAARRVFSSSLQYRAGIAFRRHVEIADSAYEDVYVARMELNWSYDDGTYESLIEAHRIVILSRHGAVLSLRGDGAALEEMQISPRMRGEGRDSR
jgi:hypothetical protein